MRLFFLLLLLLLLGRHAAFAQALPPSAALVPPAAPAADTMAAIHRLFAAKRKKNGHFFVGTLAIVAVGGVVLGTAPSSWDGLDQAVLGGAIVACIGLPTLAVEAVIALDYNKKSERRALEDFQAHRMPRYLKRQLKPKYFRVPPQGITDRG